MEYDVHIGEDTLKGISDAIKGAEIQELNVTENGTYRAEGGKGFSPVNVNVSGGGGSSDFTTAKVTTIWSDAEEQTVLTIPCGITEDNVSATVIYVVTSEGSGTIFDVPLYKGLCVLEVTVAENEEIITTGDITFKDGVLFISGDGTITISGTR